MKFFFLIFFTILISFWTIRPIFQSGFFPVHDNAQISRVYEMARALGDGMFPVRWSEDFGYGYGYPIFNFYAPLSYYIGAYLQFITHTDPLEATKLMVAFGILLAGVTMFLLAREFWGDSGALVSSILYMYAPYHAVDLYVRGDVAEFWAYAFIPLVFYSIWKAYVTEKKKFIIIGSIGFAGLILSHNLTAFMITPFLGAQLSILFILDHKRYPKKIFIALKTLVLGVLLSAWYWLPVLFEVPYTNVLSQTAGGFDFHRHFVCFSQFWYSPWGYGGSVPGCNDGLSFMLGKMHIIITAISILFAVLLYRKEDRAKLTIVVGIFSLFSLLLTTEISKPLWEIIRPMAFFQFPWRFLIMVAFSMSFISGFSIWTLRHTIFSGRPIIVYVGVIVLLSSIIFLYSKFFVPKTMYTQNLQSFTDRNYIAWNLSNDAHEYLPKNFIIPKDPKNIPSHLYEVRLGHARIDYQTLKTQQKDAVIHADTQSVIHANIAYFPGWTAVMDNKDALYNITPNGMDILVSKGDHTISFIFRQTLIEKIANTISLIGILIMLTGIIIRRKNFLL